MAGVAASCTSGFCTQSLDNIYEKFITIDKGRIFNAHVKQTGDVPVMDQAGGSTQILEYCIVHVIQNSFGDHTCSLNLLVIVLSVTSVCSSELAKCLIINAGRHDRKLKFPPWGKGIKTYFLFFLTTSKFFESTTLTCAGCSTREVNITGTSQNCVCWKVPWRNQAFSVQKYTCHSRGKSGWFMVK